MKNILLYVSFLCAVILSFSPDRATAQSCCPDFILRDAIEICPPEGACGADGTLGDRHSLAACKLSLHTYTVYPNDLASFTYTWTVTGGTPTSFSGNPINVIWGSGATGFIKVVINSIDPTLNCQDSIMMEVCLIDGPQADIGQDYDTICAGSPVNFYNLSTGGTVTSLSMGDGTVYTSITNPQPHTYLNPGTYTVVLTVQDMGAGQYIPGQGQEAKVPCGCMDTDTTYVVVLPGVGPTIETDCCYGTVCPGDTSYFCTPMVCSNYSWSAAGGTIIPPANAQCIKVVWDATYSVPTTVTLQSCSGSTCPGSTTINVPVLYPNLPIGGPNVLCIGATGTYSLPTLPGTFYKWTVSGGTHTFNDKDRNVPEVNISFAYPGTYWVKCEYQNPMAGCNGVDSIQVDVLPKFIIYGPDRVCEGDTTFFSASGPATWSFSGPGPNIVSGNGTPNVSVVWTPGNFVLTANSLNPPAFCNTVATKNVEVVAKPILANIIGADSICTGDNYVYGISSNVSGSSFIWNIISGTGTIMSQMGDDNDSIAVQFSTPGPWTLEVYQEIEIGPGDFCQSLPVTKTIYPFLPPVISGLNTVCVDAVEPYYASGSNPPGGFQWSVSPSNRGTIVSGQGTNSVSVKWHGPATTAILSVTSCAGSFSFPVTINTPPTAIATPSQTPVFCIGTTGTLVISTPFVGTYSYQWYDNFGILSGETGPSLSLNIGSYTPGTYSFYVLVTENGCTRKSNIVNMIIKACPPPDPDTGNCDVLAQFSTYVVCNTITLINSTLVIPPATVTNWSWTITGPGTGTFTPGPNVANPGLTVSASGTYTITLTATSSTGCTTSWSETVNILLPVASFTSTAPACENSPISFTPNPYNLNYNYYWTFGDGSTSYDPITQHAYSVGAPTKYYVNLLITDPYGCTATALDSIWVNPNPVCNITATDTAFCPGSSVTLYACNGMSSYQWYKNGTALSGANADSLVVNQYGKYWVEVTNSYGCTSISNKMYIYMYQKPKAKITGDGYYCASVGETIWMQLNTIFNTNYSYNWYSIPAGAAFSPVNGSSTWGSITASGPFPEYHQVVVDVTDIITGCVNSDTLCITIYEKPSFTIISIPQLDVCEGTPVKLIPSLQDLSNYNYLWSNGATTDTTTVSTPGFYSLTITNKITGCSSTVAAGWINPKPDLSLFPIGCAQLCNPDTLLLYIPLPLNALPPFNTYASAYPSITWYNNGAYAGTGPTLAYPIGAPGNHQFSVKVTNHFGCTDSTGVFCLTSGCCNIILENLTVTPSSCPQTSDGSFTIVLDPATTGGPFTITSIPVVPPLPVAILPGVPLTVNNLPPGTYTIIIQGPTEECSASYTVVIEHAQDYCCFAEIDPQFVKILVNTTYSTDMVWDGKYYLDDGVIVTVNNGAVLDITNVDVVFGECAGIVFQGGGWLRSNNSVYRPCDVDQTWKGLRFIGPGKFDNLVNECTFKNAEVALYFQQTADAVISANLFSNCNYGIRVEGHNNFNHPISGNRFVTEQFFPVWDCPTKYSFINNSSSYGIWSSTTRFREQISQNNFVNSWGNSIPQTHGIYQLNSGSIISSNTFTDQSYAIYLNVQYWTTIIENNDIENNEQVNSTLAPIYINATTSPLVEINNNRISDNYHQSNCFSAIYAVSSRNMSIMNNVINGFNYGIYINPGRAIQISGNEIRNSGIVGIYFRGGKGNFLNYISCNEVYMRTFGNTRSFYSLELNALTEITTNCFNDSYVAMDVNTASGYTLPKIRNNFLYNYTLTGINAAGYSGNIGTLVPPDPGLNTLWSNYNPAIDINSTMPISVADNFGMFNISSGTVTITSNRPYHSTASCSQQIFNMPSQGNLNVNYVCDNFSKLFTTLQGAGGQYQPVPGFKELLKSSENQYVDAELILASVENANQELLDEILSVTNLSAGEQTLLLYNYYYRNGDLAIARSYINQFIPENEEEADFKTLSILDLDIMDNGWDSLTDEDLTILNQIMARNSSNTNYAISLLNNSPTYREHTFDVVEIKDVTVSPEIQQVEQESEFLKLFPNPATNKVYIEYMNSKVSESRIELHDVSGKLISNYQLEYISGGIEIDISSLREGFYFVTLTDATSGIVRSGKLVKVNPGRQ